MEIISIIEHRGYLQILPLCGRRWQQLLGGAGASAQLRQQSQTAAGVVCPQTARGQAQTEVHWPGREPDPSEVEGGGFCVVPAGVVLRGWLGHLLRPALARRGWLVILGPI